MSEIIKVRLDQLILDSQNPRIQVHFSESTEYDENLIINVLQTKEELHKIIDSIKGTGWNSLSRPIVIPSKQTGIYTVKDGNRRVASLKYLKKDNIDVLQGNPLEVELTENTSELAKKLK